MALIVTATEATLLPKQRWLSQLGYKQNAEANQQVNLCTIWKTSTIQRSLLFTAPRVQLIENCQLITSVKGFSQHGLVLLKRKFLQSHTLRRYPITCNAIRRGEFIWKFLSDQGHSLPNNSSQVIDLILSHCEEMKNKVCCKISQYRTSGSRFD